MNLRNNRGYTGVDISVAMIIIMLFIPTIFGMTYNIKKNESYNTKKGHATQIALEILEMAKSVEYQNLDKGFNEENDGNSENFLNKLISRFGNTVKPDVSNNSYVYKIFALSGSNGEIFEIRVGLKNYYPADIDYYHANQDVIKKVNVIVTYSVGAKTETIELCLPIKNEEYYRKEILS